jgi:hypothetical protein
VSFVLESCSSAQSCPGGIWHSTARVHNLSTETAQVFEFGRSQPRSWTDRYSEWKGLQISRPSLSSPFRSCFPKRRKHLSLAVPV